MDCRIFTEKKFCKPVSILVLMDHLFGHGMGALVPIRGPVSILVLMDHLFGQDSKKAMQDKSYVSILVLMDHLFGHGFTISYCNGVFCFNPCFDGSPFWTTFRAELHHVSICFNPCFDGSPFWTR